MIVVSLHSPDSLQTHALTASASGGVKCRKTDHEEVKDVQLHKTDAASLADLKVLVTYILSEADMVDADPMHLAQQLQVLIQRAADPV